MQRSKLRKIVLKKRTEGNRNNYVKQRNLCVTLLRKSKREFFGSLNETHLCNNKKCWGMDNFYGGNYLFNYITQSNYCIIEIFNCSFSFLKNNIEIKDGCKFDKIIRENL